MTYFGYGRPVGLNIQKRMLANAATSRCAACCHFVQVGRNQTHKAKSPTISGGLFAL